MTVISATGLSKLYGVEEIFSGVSFAVEKGDRVGLVGANGVGKTTLFNILAGDEPYDDGSFFIAGDLNVGYFRQNDLFTSEKTVYEEMLSIFDEVRGLEARMQELPELIAARSAEAGEEDPELHRLLAEYDRVSEQFRRMDGFSYKSEIAGVLNSMAFPQSYYDKKTAMLSGGERTRLALASLLLKKPDILMLDEPTNHLDIGTLKWLEQYLRGYKGTVLLISHDRYFLDSTVTRIFELEQHRLSVYEGNYTFYAGEKKVRFESELKAYEKQSAEIARQEDMIRRYKERGTEKLAKRAKSREKALEKVDRLDRPTQMTAKMNIKFSQESQSGNDVIEAVDVGRSFGMGDGARTLFTGVNFDIKRGERICIIGPNGTGKTTLLKVIMSQIPTSEGHVRIGHNVVFGYYDQEQTMLSETSSVIEEMRDAYSLYGDRELRSFLGRFMFRGEDVFKPVSALSGGERARLALLKLMLSGSNVLVLDEPTNHLDIPSKEVFEDALVEFPGTCIIVSHDRYLLNKVPTSIYELTKEGITVYPGKYDYYTEKKEAITSANSYLGDLARANSTAADAASGKPVTDREKNIEDRRKTKELQAEERRRQRKIAELEDRIAVLEEEIEGLKNEMCSEEYLTDHVKLSELSGQMSEKQAELDEKYEQWEELSQ